MLSKYKKIIITTTLLTISNYCFASIDDCYNAGKDKSKIEEYCTPYLKDKKYPEATAILAAIQKDNKITLDYDLWVINYYDKNGLRQGRNGIKGYANLVATAGNIYYFGQAGKADKTKGLEYITKAANLGNDFAQYQLGTFYVVDESEPSQDVATAYKWFKLSDINKDQENKSDNYTSQLMQFAKDKKTPYCIGMGEQLVAQAYLDGTAGLSKDKSKAKKYLSQAIAVYKDNEPTKASYKYCAKQKGLDLASAEKLLGSL
jgi:TPR repeat protein